MNFEYAMPCSSRIFLSQTFSFSNSWSLAISASSFSGLPASIAVLAPNRQESREQPDLSREICQTSCSSYQACHCWEKWCQENTSWCTYYLCLFAGIIIQGRVMPLMSFGIILLTLFHTRAWWQQALRVSVSTESQDSNTGACKQKRLAICFLRPLSFRFL